jgi:hypothetical protein
MGTLPNAGYLLPHFASLDTATAFPAGLRLLIDGFRQWLPPQPKAKPMKPHTPAQKAHK